MNKRIQKKCIYKYFHPFHMLANQILNAFWLDKTASAKKLALKLGNTYVPPTIECWWYASNFVTDVETLKPTKSNMNDLRREIWSIWYHQNLWNHNKIFN